MTLPSTYSQNDKPDLLRIFTAPFLFVVGLWLVQYYAWKQNLDFTRFGLFPLETKGLLGILTEPLIHENFFHLFSNSIPLVILGGMMFHFYREISLKVFFLIYFLTGFFTWFYARPVFHIGSSGLVYGLAGFLFVSGLVRKNFRLQALSLLVTFLYGSMAWGVLPIPADHSWETHLSGAVSGIALAWLFRKKGPAAIEYDFGEEEDPENERQQAPLEGPVRIMYVVKNPESITGSSSEGIGEEGDNRHRSDTTGNGSNQSGL